MGAKDPVFTFRRQTGELMGAGGDKEDKDIKIVKGLGFYPTCNLQASQLGCCGFLDAGGLPVQRQRSLLLHTLSVTLVSWLSQFPEHHSYRVIWRGPGDTHKCREFCYRRDTLSLGNLNLL